MIGVHACVHIRECLRQDCNQQIEGDNLDEHCKHNVNNPIGSAVDWALGVRDFTQHELIKEAQVHEEFVFHIISGLGLVGLVLDHGAVVFHIISGIG